jgi:hypothetical protein
MTSSRALTSGFWTTIKSYRMILLLYAVNFILAAVLAFTFESVLTNSIGDSLSLEKLVKDFDYTTYNDFMFKHGGKVHSLMSAVDWLVAFYLFLNVLLGGGLISTVNEHGDNFSLKSFFAECGAYFSRFFRLFLISLFVLFLVSAITGFFLGIIFSASTESAVSEVLPMTLGGIFFALFLFVVMLIVLIADYAKVMTVVNEGTSMLKVFWQSVKFVFQNFFRVIGLQIVMLLLTLLAMGIYLILERQIGTSSAGAVVGLFLVQQIFVASKVSLRVWIFSGQVELFKGIDMARPIAPDISTAAPSIPEPELPQPEISMAPKAAVAPEPSKPATRKKPVAKKRATPRRSTAKTVRRK